MAPESVPPPLTVDYEILRKYSPTVDPLSLMACLERNSLEIQGKKVTYKKHGMRYPKKGGGIRGKVFGMSNASRLNLLKKLAVWDWERIEWSLFVTLTYPDEVSMPIREVRNKHRSIFARKMESELSRDVPCLWRVEYEIRQSGRHVGDPCPHWHLLLPTVRWIDKDDVNKWWRRVIDWPGYTRTETKGASKAEGAAMYIGKYLGKSASSNSLVYASYHNDSGRHWGILREEQIPLCEKIVIERLTDVEAEWLREFAEQFLAGVDSRLNTSFTLLGTIAEDCIQEFMKKRIATLR